MTTKQFTESSISVRSGRSDADRNGASVGGIRRRPRRAVSLRLVLLTIAILSLIFAVVRQALLSWDIQRRIPASQRLLLPLIHWHEAYAEQYRLTEGIELDLARSRSKRFREDLLWSMRSVMRTGHGASSELRAVARSLKALIVNPPGQRGPTVLENYQSSVWSSHMATYHDHMKAHYEKLLSELWTELPPTPAALDAELRACQAEIRRIRRRPELDLYSETAPHLRPGAPKPIQPPWNGSGSDSF